MRQHWRFLIWSTTSLSLVIGTSYLRGQSCPEWSPKFDQVTDLTLRQGLLQARQAGWASAGNPQQVISALNVDRSQVGAKLATDQTIINQIAVGVQSQPSPADCSGTSALSAARCDYYRAAQEMLVADGSLEIYQCLAGRTGAAAFNSTQTAGVLQAQDCRPEAEQRRDWERGIKDCINLGSMFPGDAVIRESARKCRAEQFHPSPCQASTTGGSQASTAKLTTLNSSLTSMGQLMSVLTSRLESTTPLPSEVQFEKFEQSVASQGVLGDKGQLRDSALNASVAALVSGKATPDVDEEIRKGCEAQVADARVAGRELTMQGCIDKYSISAGDAADSKQQAKDKNSGDDLDMLDSSGHLKAQFVGSTSGSSGRSSLVSGGVANGQPVGGSSDAQSDLSNCAATVDAVLNGADPYPGGAMLHFSVKIGSGMRPPGEFGGAVLPASQVIQYAIELTVQSAAGNTGPLQQQFQTPVTAGQGEATADVPVNGTAEARDKLLGWRVVAVKCLSSADGGKTASSNANCAELLDYRDHELGDQQLVLIKKYGIYAQGKAMIGGIRQQLMDDVKEGVGVHQQLLIKITTLMDLAQGIYAIAVPEGAAVHVTAKIIYDAISAYHDGREAIKSMAEHDWLSALTTLTPNLNPVVAAGKALYGLAQDMKKLNEQQELQETFQSRLDQMDSGMAAYDDTLQKLFAQANTLEEVRRGITMACPANGGRP